METIERRKLEQDLEWVETIIQRLVRTNEYRDIKNSLYILEKRKRAISEKLG
jgi:hypothetical protein